MAAVSSSAVPVLYVANSPKIGGGARVLMDLIHQLDRRRFLPHLVIPARGPLADWAVEYNIPYFLSPEGDWSRAASFVRRSLQILGIIARTRAGIVHAAAPMCYRALGLAAGMANAARVCHLGFPPAEGELERSFLSGPDAVIACYERQATEQEDLISRIAPRCRTVAIPNGVDLERFNPAAPADEDAQQWRFGGRHVVAILGHVSEVKGYPAFVDAAARVVRSFPDCTFVAIGAETTHFGFQEHVRGQVRRAGIEDRFHFIGFQTDVAAVLRSVDVVTLPSLSEGLPLAALEAMACGKPVVGSAVGGVPEAIVSGQSGLLIPPGSPDALAEAVVALLQDPVRARAMGMAARRRVEEQFSLTGFAARVQELYGSLITSGPSAIPLVAGRP